MKRHKLNKKELEQLYKEESTDIKDRIKDAIEGKCNVYKWKVK